MNIILSQINNEAAFVAAQRLCENFLGAPWKDLSADVLVITQPGTVGNNASLLAQRLREAKPEAIVFYGSITDPTEMLTAVGAVKRYCEQTGRDPLAIYIEPKGTAAVVLTDKFNPKGVEATEAKRVRKSAPGLTMVDTLLAADQYISAELNDVELFDAWKQILRKLDSGGQLEEDLTVLVYGNGMGYADALDLILREAMKQDERHGADRTYSLLQWLAVINEEVLEFTREVVTLATTNPSPESRKEMIDASRAELVQVGALCLQTIKSFYKAPKTNEFKTDKTLDILIKLEGDVYAAAGKRGKTFNATQSVSEKLFELLPVSSNGDTYRNLSDLKPDQRPAMHEFLLSLLRQYENE